MIAISQEDTLTWGLFGLNFCFPECYQHCQFHACLNDRGLDAPSGSRPACRPPFLRKKGGKELAPTAPDPFATLRGNLRRQALGAVRQNSLRVFDAPFKHVAVKVITMQLHSAVQLPAPRACRHRRGHKGQYRVREQNSFSINFDSCYRNKCMDFKPISSQISQAVRSLPSVCACGTRFRLWATLP